MRTAFLVAVGRPHAAGSRVFADDVSGGTVGAGLEWRWWAMRGPEARRVGRVGRLRLGRVTRVADVATHARVGTAVNGGSVDAKTERERSADAGQAHRIRRCGLRAA